MKKEENLVIRAPGDPIDMKHIAQIAAKASAMVRQVRNKLLAPEARKISPTLPATRLCNLCHFDKAHLAYRVSKGDLPAGTLTPTGRRRDFTIAEFRQWARLYRKDRLRPVGLSAITMACTNFKGGVTKTSTCMTLAQGLSMRGHRVLAIDADPQGSLTSLFGILPMTEVSHDMTIMPLFTGESANIRSSIRSTYWDGIDLVCANPLLFTAEFDIPARQMLDPSFKFWDALNAGIDSVRDLYDVILIDCPPSLGNLTLNALWASDGLIVPIPPSGLDFASLAQFWSLLSDLGINVDKQNEGGKPKQFDFLHLLMSSVDNTDTSTAAVRQWILATYAELVAPVEIPKTAVTKTKSAEFATIYDIQKWDGSQQTFNRAFDAYERLIDFVENSLIETWKNRVSK